MKGMLKPEGPLLVICTTPRWCDATSLSEHFLATATATGPDIWNCPWMRASSQVGCKLTVAMRRERARHRLHVKCFMISEPLAHVGNYDATAESTSCCARNTRE
jgi:hypothetical protein